MSSPALNRVMGIMKFLLFVDNNNIIIQNEM